MRMGSFDCAWHCNARASEASVEASFTITTSGGCARRRRRRVDAGETFIDVLRVIVERDEDGELRIAAQCERLRCRAIARRIRRARALLPVARNARGRPPALTMTALRCSSRAARESFAGLVVFSFERRAEEISQICRATRDAERVPAPAGDGAGKFVRRAVPRDDRREDERRAGLLRRRAVARASPAGLGLAQMGARKIPTGLRDRFAFRRDARGNIRRPRAGPPLPP